MEPAKLLEAAIGIAVVVFLVWKLFPKPAPLTIERVKINFFRCFPDMPVASVLLDQSDSSALIGVSDSPDQFGIAKQMGDRVMIRLMKAEDIQNIDQVGKSVKLSFKDFTLPAIKITLDAEAYKMMDTIFPMPNGEKPDTEKTASA